MTIKEKSVIERVIGRVEGLAYGCKDSVLEVGLCRIIQKLETLIVESEGDDK